MQTNLQKDLIGAHANGLKSSIHALEVQVTILKQLITSGKGAQAAVDEEEEDLDTAPASDDTEEDEEEIAPKKVAAKKKAAVNFGDDEDEEDEAPAPAAKKAKKITADQVNDACKAHAAENGIKATKALLLKKFKTASITEIDPSKYADVLKAMEV
jgi:hypothetical protein